MNQSSSYQLKDIHWQIEASPKVRQTNRFCTICIHRVLASLTRSSFQFVESFSPWMPLKKPLQLDNSIDLFFLYL